MRAGQSCVASRSKLRASRSKLRASRSKLRASRSKLRREQVKAASRAGPSCVASRSKLRASRSELHREQARAPRMARQSRVFHRVGVPASGQDRRSQRRPVRSGGKPGRLVAASEMATREARITPNGARAMHPADRHDTRDSIDVRLEDVLRYALAIGAVLVLLLPAARGFSATLGWLPLWLLAMPLSALWALHGFRLPRRAAEPRDTAARRRRARSAGAPAGRGSGCATRAVAARPSRLALTAAHHVLGTASAPGPCASVRAFHRLERPCPHCRRPARPDRSCP